MTSAQSSVENLPVGSFAEAARFHLLVALRMTYAERLRDLEAMWDFNDMMDVSRVQLKFR